MANASTERDWVIQVAQDSKFEKKIFKRVKQGYLKVEFINTKQWKVGNLAYIERRTGFPDGKTNIEKLFTSIDIFKKLLTTAFLRRKIVYAVGLRSSIDKIKKILERIYRDSDTEILINTITKLNKKEKEASILKAEETVVNAEGNTYADLLKKVSHCQYTNRWLKIQKCKEKRNLVIAKTKNSGEFDKLMKTLNAITKKMTF